MYNVPTAREILWHFLIDVNTVFALRTMGKSLGDVLYSTFSVFELGTRVDEFLAERERENEIGEDRRRERY
jgi:hypothetical protein